MSNALHPNPSPRDRRLGLRVPLEIFMTQYIRDRPVRALTTNVSDTGIFVQTVASPTVRRAMDRKTPVALEFELPGTGEIIWARGELCYGTGDQMVHGTGVRFTAMPTIHARLLRDFCVETRRARLGSLLARIRGQA
ncbi:MAG TPA: PilZ domain-containing protein [Kofleriaceae bacterium]|nr:PilZ domain-containing protein [Kofleriaceae bacterium]